LNKLERIIVTKTPLGFLLRKCKKVHLPGFEGVPLYDVIIFFYKQIKTVGLTERASAIAYNFIMAIPPSFLFLFTLIPSLPFISKRSIKLQLHGIITDIIPLKVHNENLIKFVDSFIDSSKIGVISFGFILALYFASNAMITQGAVLKVIGIKSVTILNTIYYVRWIFIVAMIFYSMAFIYKYAPAVHKRWKLVSPGTILATSLSILLSVGFSYFVNNFGRYNALYGSIGTIIVLMALIYINSLVLLIGFELNVSIKTLKSIAEQREITEKKIADF